MNVTAGLLTIGATGNLTTTGTVDVSGTARISAAAVTSTITGNVNVTSTAFIAYTGVIAGAGSTVTVDNLGAGGYFRLAGNNSYGGLTTVTSGSLGVNATGNLGTTGVGTIVQNTGNLFLESATIGTEALTINGSGNANFVNTGAALVGGGTSSYAGAITLGSAASIAANVGSTLTLTGGINKNGQNLTLLTVNGTSGTININTAGISGAADVIVDHVTVNENFANTYNGPTFIRSNVTAGTGILNANVLGALPTATRTALTMDDAGLGASRLNLGADQSVASLQSTTTGAASSLINLSFSGGDHTLTIGTAGGMTTFAGVISGGGITKDGTSTQILSGANNYTGATTVNDGVLQAGNASAFGVNSPTVVSAPGILDIGGFGVTIGSLAGDGTVRNNGAAATLTLGGGDQTGSFSGAIQDGTGVLSLIKTGTGTETLSGTNTFTGTATVNGGVLQLQNGAAIADVVAVTVTAPGSLDLNNANETIGSLAGTGAVMIGANTLTTGFNNTSTTYGGNITGTSGGVTKIGMGTWTLNGTGSNTFTGAFNVNDGTVELNMSGTDATGQGPLNIGDGVGAAGSAVVRKLQDSEIANLSAVTINTDGRLDMNNFSDTIGSLAGSGTVTLGTGTLITGGANNLSGTYAGVISGAGSLVKNGTGTQTLNGASTYTGGTTLNAGTLAAGSTKAFGSGNLTIAGGTVRTSGGPLSVNIGGGNIAANAGTALFNVGGTTAGVTHDQIATTGNFTFAGNGSTIALVQQGGYLLAPGDKVNLVTAAGGVQGGTVNGTPYANVTASLASFSNTPLLIPTVNRYLTTVTLEAMQGSFKALAGQLGMTPNQIAVAGSLDSVAAKNLFKTGVVKELDFLSVQSLATLKNNLDKIAPEELTSIFHLGVSLSNIYANNLDRRMEDIRIQAGGGGGIASGPADGGTRFVGGAPGPRGVRSKEIAPPSNDQWGMFLTGSGEFTRVGSTTNASGYNFTTGGVTAGLDYRVNGNFAVGLSLGYANTTASLANGGSLDVDGGRLGLYATYFEENFHMDASVTGGLNSYRTRRVTPNNTIATASPNGAEINVKIGAGYDWKFGGLTVGPVISYQYTNMQLDGFTEAGAFAPLTVAGRSEESSRTSLGVRAYYDGRIGSKVFRPEVRLAWQHEFGATGYSLTSSFATLGGSPFIVSGTTIGRDSLLASAGFVIMWNDRLSTFVYYDGQFGSQNFDSHNVSAGMRLQF